MKYSPEIRDQIAQYVRDGYSKKDACTMAGIVKDTFYRWLDDKTDFSDAIEKAEVDFKASTLKTIQKASVNSWQAAAWILERRWPKEYALTSKLQAIDGDGRQVPYSIVVMPVQNANSNGKAV